MKITINKTTTKTKTTIVSRAERCRAMKRAGQDLNKEKYKTS